MNNAVYQNYLEHARHQVLKWIGLDFAELHRAGKDAVMTRAELDYLSSLASGDRFKIKVNIERKGRLRFIFHQQIIKVPSETAVLNAKITVVMLQEGKPVPPDEIVEALERKTGR